MNVTVYRQKFRQEEIPSWYNGWIHLVAFNITMLLALGFLLFILSAPVLLEFLAIPVAFIFANFCEHWFHKNIMHKQVKIPGLKGIYKRHSKDHHVFFQENSMIIEEWKDLMIVLFPYWATLVFLATIVAPLVLILGFSISMNVGILFGGTIVVYYYIYEWFHFLSHVSPFVANKLAWLHVSHHIPRIMMKNNFNIIFPIFDKALGTIKTDY